MQETLRNSIVAFIYTKIIDDPSQIHKAIRKSIGENLAEGEAGSFTTRKDKVKRLLVDFRFTVSGSETTYTFCVLYTALPTLVMLVWGGCFQYFPV